MLTLDQVAFLRSAAGEAALRNAATLDLEGAGLLRELTLLRRRLAPELAGAVLEQAQLRRQAAVKFQAAEAMLFTRGGLEQATGERVATYTAARYAAFARVADLCCGIGGDTLALARHCRVAACDSDPVRLACAAHNAAVLGLSDRITWHCVDVARRSLGTGSAGLPGVEHGGGFSLAARDAQCGNGQSDAAIEAIFFDPGRRAGERRIFSLSAYQPPVSLIERWLPSIGAIGVKVSPGVDHDEIVWPCEREFIAVNNDLKQAVLWFGPLASCERRATVLAAGATLTNTETPRPAIGEPLAWLYDPSPAVTRAGLVAELAALIGARQLDPAIAYLTATERQSTPFARCYAVESWLPFGLKRLKAHLRARGIGRVTVHKRGSPLDVDQLERELRGPGAEQRDAFLTRVAGRPAVIIGRP